MTKHPSPILRDELHTHLYGCIAAEELWEIGKDRWRQHEARLEWYAAEYEKAYGRRPDYKAYWHGSHGLELMKSDFEFREPAPFSCFQARFNLLVALLPIVPHDPEGLRLALRSQQRAGTRHLELRAFAPPYLSDADFYTYLTAMAECCLKSEREHGSTFVPRLAISLTRDDAVLEKQYKVLRTFLDMRPDCARAITAIDFCHVEEGFPPANKAEFFRRVRRDNAQHPESALAILYHVGESFEGMSLASAARWVYEAHANGAHRLGHAIALGLDPANLRGKTIHEAVSERRAHLAWLLREAPRLAALGHAVDERSAKHELDRLWNEPEEARVAITYDETFIETCRSLQDALLQRLHDAGAVIESCPTSNFRIGQIQGAARHPLPRFMRRGMRVLVSTDDPGIFAVDLKGEEALCRRDFGFGDAELERLQAVADGARSEILAGRIP